MLIGRDAGRSYRPDIDGLRCISVLAVMLFHFKVAPFSGGFVGVDIFFVISGYLITGLIVGDIERGQFSFGNFYARRIRRIVPAMLFTIACVFVAGALIFPPETLRLLSRDVLAALVALSNFNFWRDAHAYFAPAAAQLPLLHFWSLSVEEQFYAIWPAALLLLSFFAARLIPAAIALVSLASLALCAYWSTKDPSAAFYLMPFRIFEFGLGAILVYLERRENPAVVKRIGNPSFVVGLALIAASIVLFDERTWSMPGLASLVPTVGAAAVIYFGRFAPAAAVLRLKPLVGCGLISYSLYLCHWPLLVFTNYLIGDTSQSIIARSLLVVGSIAIATLMFFFVEQPFRLPRGERQAKHGFWKPAVAAGIGVIVVALPALAAYRQGGWAWRLDEGRKHVSHLQAFGFFPCTTEGRCAFGDLTKPVGLQVLGDSHSQNYVAGLDQMLRERRLRGEAFTTGGCSMLPDVWREGKREDTFCPDLRARYYKQIRTNKLPILFNQSWTSYEGADPDRMAALRKGLEQMYADLDGDQRQFILVGGQVFAQCEIEPYRLELGPLSSNHAPCGSTPADERRKETAPVNAMLRDFQSAHPEHVTLLFPEDVLCDKATCRTMRDGIFLYRDPGHFTVEGSRLVVHAKANLIENVLPRD